MLDAVTMFGRLAAQPPTDVADLLARASRIATDAATSAAAIDGDGCFPADEFAALASGGLLAAPLRQNLGGLGLGSEPGQSAALLRLLAILGAGSLPVARLYEGHVNALLLIQTFGNDEQVTRFASDVLDHGRLFAVWNTEQADGVHLAPADAGSWNLSGSKTFASGAGYVDRPLITAALPGGGWQMAVLAAEQLAPEIDESWWRPHGMRASASYRIDFTGGVIDAGDLIGAPGDYYRQPWFSGGAVRFAAAQLGGAAALLDAARGTLRAMDRTGDPLQVARMADAAIAIESGLLWLTGAARMADQSELSGSDEGSVGAVEMITYAGMTRTAIERICLQTIETVERSIGARALMRPHPIERIGRDLRMYLRQPAPDATLLDVGRAVLESSLPMLELWPAATGVPDGTND